MTATATSAPVPQAPPGRTVLGVDRSLLAPAAIILAIVLFFAVGVPAIDAVVQHDVPITAGTVLPAGMGVQFTPATSWGQVPSGDLVDSATGPGTVAVEQDGVRFAVTTGTFHGSLTGLTDTITRRVGDLDGTHVAGSATSVTTAQGVTGTVTPHRGATTDAQSFAFLRGKAGVQVLVSGPSQSMTIQAAAVERMIDSITIADAAADPNAGGSQ